MGRFDRIARGMRPKSLIDYARLEEPDFSPSGSEIVAESFENAVKTASEALLQGKRDQMQFQLQMEDRNLKQKQVIAQTNLAQGQVDKQDDQSSLDILKGIDLGNEATVLKVIGGIKDENLKQNTLSVYQQEIQPLNKKKDKLEAILKNKSVHDILKIPNGVAQFEDYVGLKQKQNSFLGVPLDDSILLKYKDYNEYKNIYDLINSEKFQGDSGLDDASMLVLKGTVGVNLEKRLLDMVSLKNPGKFDDDVSKANLANTLAKIKVLNDRRNRSIAAMSSASTSIKTAGIDNNTVEALRETIKNNNTLQNTLDSQIQTLYDSISNPKVVDTETPKAKITRILNEVNPTTGLTEKFSVNYSATGEELSRTLITEDLDDETLSQRKAREAKEAMEAKQKAEAERIKKKAEALVNKAVEEPLADTTTQRSKYSNRLLTSPRDLPLTTTTQDTIVEDEVVSEDVVETETTKTVLDTVAMETMNAIEKRNPFVKNYKPKDITKDQLLRIAKSGELTNEQLNAVADFLTANAGKVIKPAKNNRDLRELISIIFSK